MGSKDTTFRGSPFSIAVVGEKRRGDAVFDSLRLGRAVSRLVMFEKLRDGIAKKSIFGAGKKGVSRSAVYL